MSTETRASRTASHLRSLQTPSRVRKHFETQGTGGRDGLDQSDLHLVSQPIHGPGSIADKGVRCFVVPPELATERRGGDEAISPCFSKPYEEAGARDAGYTGRKLGADTVGKEGGNQAVDGVSLRRHGSPLGLRD
jgi:hypothetical protein